MANNFVASLCCDVLGIIAVRQRRPSFPGGHNATPPFFSSPFFLFLLPHPLLNRGPGYHPRKNFGIKDDCR